MSNIECLTNNNYKVLSYLYDRKDKNNLVKITQNELSKEINLNRTTVNTIFKELILNGFLIHDKSRVGRYYLTNLAVKTIELFKKSEKLEEIN